MFLWNLARSKKVLSFRMFVILTQGAGGRHEEAAVSRYSSQYEQRLDPFTAFNQRVSDVLVPPRTRMAGKTHNCFFSYKDILIIAIIWT